MNKLLLPYNGKVELESKYGTRNLFGEIDWHNGIDLVGLDSKIIISPCDGIVGNSTIITDKNDKTWEWGNYVRIDVDNISIYLCHMSERFVEVGEHVTAGMPIGVEGNTGYSFGNHCHFETRKNYTPFNPCSLLGIPNEYGIYENKTEEIKYGHAWSEDAIKWAIDSGLIKGYSSEEKNYKLEQPITREEMLVILYRYDELKNGYCN